MAIQAIGGVSGSASATAVNRAEEPSGARRTADAVSKDSTVVISRVTKTRDDGSTVTTTTYADGHTKIETTPPKFSADGSNGSQASGTGADRTQANASEAGARVTAVDILA